MAGQVKEILCSVSALSGPCIGHNQLSCCVFIVQCCHSWLPLSETIRPNWKWRLTQSLCKSVVYKRLSNPEKRLLFLLTPDFLILLEVLVLFKGICCYLVILSHTVVVHACLVCSIYTDSQGFVCQVKFITRIKYRLKSFICSVFTVMKQRFG